MGSRRRGTVSHRTLPHRALPHRALPLIVLSTLGAVACTTAAGLAGAPRQDDASGSPRPLIARIGQVQCADLSGLASIAPWVAQDYGPDLKHVPTVDVDIEGGPSMLTVPYTITVNGQQKGSGSVAARGHVHQSVNLPNGKDVRLVVSSGKAAVAERTLQVHC